MKKLIICLSLCPLLIMVLSTGSNAQFLERLEQKAKQKLDKSVDKQVDKTIDNAQQKSEKATQSTLSNESTLAENNDPDVEKTAVQTSPVDKKADYVSSYKSKFDFVPGEKVILFDDFNEDAVGDFPGKWFTNGSGEIVSLDGVDGKWLMIKGRSQAYFDQLLDLPENFTIQFDLLCSVPFTWYSDVFNIYMEDIKDLDRYRKGENGGEISDSNINHHFWMDLHPGVYNSSHNTKGYGHYRLGDKGAKMELEEIWMPGAEKNLLKVSIWKQGQRLRVYLNENKILDLPKFLPADMKPNLIVFEPYELSGEDRYFISDLRIAVGNPDTRSRLITDGKLVTNGILFSVNSAEIKTESYGVLKEIAQILKDNPDIRVKIVGHTDSDGDEANNLELSKKRAEAVKNVLAKDFNIDPNRISTDGKGESEPLEPNTSAINKANNRRVEFLKVS